VNGRSVLQEAIGRIGAGGTLERSAAAEAMGAIMDGEATASQIGAFLLGLRVRGETVEEITGFAQAIRSRAMPVAHAYPGLVDTCGTGGDGLGTFNISTTAAFIVAGAGLKVAKHGNRAISSRTGSADVLEALGVMVDMAGPEAAGALDAVGITFLFAPTFHAAMRHAGPVRRELATRTVFNVLGPLCNPAGATAQVVGVFDPALTRPMAQVLGNLGVRRAFVVHGSDGLDELTVTSPSRVAEWTGSAVREYMIDPADVGLQRWPAQALAGGDAATNAGILRSVLQGVPGGARDVATLNAAAALVAADAAEDLRHGLDLARASIDSGAAVDRLESLLAYSARLRSREGGTRIAEERVPPVQPGWGNPR
jgi:anthranilate phosphoribosyltransferase